MLQLAMNMKKGGLPWWFRWKRICLQHGKPRFPGLGRSPGWGHGKPFQYSLPGESPWTEEPGRLESMGSQRVRYDWATKHTHTWRKEFTEFKWMWVTNREKWCSYLNYAKNCTNNDNSCIWISFSYSSDCLKHTEETYIYKFNNYLSALFII